jgi:hypothetical protein
MLARPHLSINQKRKIRMTKPDATLLIDVISPKVLQALHLASEALSKAHVRHVVVGGIAVGANGYPRATKDVYFLVGAEAFHHHANGLVTMRPDIPFQVNGVAIDLLSPEEGEDFLEQTLEAIPGTMMEAAPLVYMKLKSPRRKDHVDVIEMIKGGIDVKQCRAYLVTHASHLVAAFDDSVTQAESEEG